MVVKWLTHDTPSVYVHVLNFKWSHAGNGETVNVWDCQTLHNPNRGEYPWTEGSLGRRFVIDRRLTPLDENIFQVMGRFGVFVGYRFMVQAYPLMHKSAACIFWCNLRWYALFLQARENFLLCDTIWIRSHNNLSLGYYCIVLPLPSVPVFL